MAEKKLTLDIINAQGMSLVSARKIYIRDGKIAMDGNIMGTMPSQFYITPLNLYKATKLVDFDFLKGAAKLLCQGRKEYREKFPEETDGEEAKKKRMQAAFAAGTVAAIAATAFIVTR